MALDGPSSYTVSSTARLPLPFGGTIAANLLEEAIRDFARSIGIIYTVPAAGTDRTVHDCTYISSLTYSKYSCYPVLNLLHYTVTNLTDGKVPQFGKAFC
jgi:hypothetical protein